ncbi:hypothetical protein ABZT02_08650 [Streptomyces sp. NPDC005402]|uniref:hypothetical protein n=1 Tax=Streptomyces sp. NPDC005402 TaxID=3155338 RepID=UPI0033B51C8E
MTDRNGPSAQVTAHAFLSRPGTLWEDWSRAAAEGAEQVTSPAPVRTAPRA